MYGMEFEHSNSSFMRKTLSCRLPATAASIPLKAPALPCIARMSIVSLATPALVAGMVSVVL